MVSKLDLQKIISKYHLNGLIDSVKWVVNNKQLTIKFNAPNRDMIGEVKHDNFDLENSEIAIYNTNQLDKLLEITSGNLNLQLEKTNKIYSRLIIEDINYKLNYSLSDLLLIQEPGKVNDPNDYIIESNLESNTISAIIKAKNALQSTNVNFTITRNFDSEQVLTMIFGDQSNHTNKIEFIVPDTKIVGEQYNFNIPFNSEMLKSIFANNKDAHSAKMSLNIQGLLKLTFHGENWQSIYYIVRKADQ